MSFGVRARRRSTGADGPPRFSLFAALTIVLVLAFGSVTTAVAQDASPEASPISGECNAPEVPEGTPEPMPEGSPEAGMDMASPEASPVVEDAPEVPTGEPVTDQAVIDEVTAGFAAGYTCFNEGDFLSAAALTTENFRTNEFGTPNLYSVAAIFEEFAAGGFEVEILEINEVLDLGDGRYAVDYDQAFFKEVERYLDVLVEEDGFYLLDESYVLAPETDLDSVSIGLQAATDESEYAYAISPAEVQQKPATLIRFYNVGEMEHEAIIFKTPDDFDPATLLEIEGPGDLPEGVELVADGFALPAQEQTMLLLDLEIGTYTIYCFIPAPDGESHAAKGMITQFTVVEAVAPDVPDVVGGSPEATPAD